MYYIILPSASEFIDNVASTSQVNQTSQTSEYTFQTTKATTPAEASGAGAGEYSISGAGAGSASTSNAGVDDVSTFCTAFSDTGTCDADAEDAAALLSSSGEHQLSKPEPTTTSGTIETSNMQTGLNDD